MQLTGALTVSVVREALARGVPLRLRVHGRSMRPTIEDGATIELHPLDGALRPGDLLACATHDRLVVHRLVRVLADGALVLRGDALLRCDPPRARGDLLGRVVAPGGAGLRGLLLRARVALARVLRRAR